VEAIRGPVIAREQQQADSGLGDEERLPEHEEMREHSARLGSATCVEHAQRSRRRVHRDEEDAVDSV
jgi:hypothetical protein